MLVYRNNKIFLLCELKGHFHGFPGSPLHAPGSKRGETLVGAGHVSPREKLDPGRGPSPAKLCQDLLSTPKKRLPLCCAQPTRNSFNWLCFSVVFIYCNINLKAKEVRCLEALYFGKDEVAVLPKRYGKIVIFHLLHSLCYGIRS